MSANNSYPKSINETVLNHAPGSAERVALTAELDKQQALVREIPAIVGGERIR